jgi:glucokinase
MTVDTIGVDVGGTHLRVAQVDGKGAIGHDISVPTPDWPEVVDTIVTGVQHVVDATTGGPASIGAVGVGLAAIIDLDGVARYAPNIPGLIDEPLQADIAKAVDLPVVVDNDANVAAWGEVMHGAAHGVRHGLVLTLGTGIGGGIIIDGRVYRGAHGLAAEVGHWQFDPRGRTCACGEPGHWEAWASGSGLGVLAREAAANGALPSVLERAGGRVDAVDGVHVGDAALAGEPDALALLDTYADYVAIGCAGLANILDPEVIVISGGLVNLGDILLDRIRDRFPRHIEAPAHRPPIPIVPAALGDQAGVVGAAVRARELLT